MGLQCLQMPVALPGQRSLPKCFGHVDGSLPASPTPAAGFAGPLNSRFARGAAVQPGTSRCLGPHPPRGQGAGGLPAAAGPVVSCFLTLCLGATLPRSSWVLPCLGGQGSMLTTSPSASFSLPPALLTLPTSSRTHLCSPPSEAGAPRAPLPVLGRGEDSAQDRAIQPQLWLQASCKTSGSGPQLVGAPPSGCHVPGTWGCPGLPLSRFPLRKPHPHLHPKPGREGAWPQRRLNLGPRSWVPSDARQNKAPNCPLSPGPSFSPLGQCSSEQGRAPHPWPRALQEGCLSLTPPPFWLQSRRGQGTRVYGMRGET